MDEMALTPEDRAEYNRRLKEIRDRYTEIAVFPPNPPDLTAYARAIRALNMEFTKLKKG